MTDELPPGTLSLPAQAVRAIYDTAARGGVNFAHGLNNHAHEAMTAGDYAAAYRLLRAALKIAPDERLILVNYAACLKFLNRTDEALAVYEKLLDRWPHFAHGLFNFTHLLLRLGDFERGWKFNRNRLFLDRSNANVDSDLLVRIKDPLLGRTYDKIALPTAQEIHERGLFIAPEQGIGDELFYLRWLAVVHRKFSPNRVYYVASPKLHAVLARHDLGAELLMRDHEIPAAVDRNMPVIALADLPLLCGHSGLHDIPPPLWLGARDREDLEAAGIERRPAGVNRWIGVTWRAGIPGSRHRGGLDKVTPPSLLGAALREIDAELVVVQRDPPHHEYMAFCEAFGRPVRLAFDGVIHPVQTELEYVLRLLNDLDDYVAVSNTNVYLRQCLGKVSRVTTPFPPAWRWMDGPGDSPWFPGHTTYRETTTEGWELALERLRADLRQEDCGGVG